MSDNTALPTYSALYAFGDSLSDAGNLSITTTAALATQPVSPPYCRQQYGAVSGNVFSNGPVWVQDLAISLGLGTLAPSLVGGSDFAYGGAETGPTPQNAGDPKIQAISLPSQFQQFQAAVSNPSANALYTLSVGANDVLGILASTGLTAQQQTTDINDAVANEIAFVNQLIGDGATNLLVLDVPDLGKAPDVTQGLVNGSNTPSAALDALASQLTSQYNTALISQLAAISNAGTASVHVVDAYQLLNAAIANPTIYGLTNVTSPVWDGNYTSASSGTLATTGTAAQDQYLFWDKLHPTETGHLALATSAQEQLSGTPALVVTDTTSGQPVAAAGQPYTGPVSGLQQQYVNLTADSLNITATTPNWFIHTSDGTDAIAVSTGNNVLDGGTGSSFLTGGSGNDTFYLDARDSPSTPVWSTIANFHAGDQTTVWGVSAADFTMLTLDNAGAPGYTGLDLLFSKPGQADVSFTLAGYSSADLGNGRLTLAYGKTQDLTDLPGSEYVTIYGH